VHASKLFKRLISLDEALNILLSNIKEIQDSEEVDLLNAGDRILAEDIYSPIDVPPFDRAEMDGYAVRAEDTFGASENNPVKLKLIGYVRIGESARIRINEKQAVAIDTGAMIPSGANAVVPLEFTEKEGDCIFVYKSVFPGENVQFAGSDIEKGELVLMKGEILDFQALGLLASIGIKRVRVKRKPRIALFVTGNELIEPGEELSKGKIYDVNTYTVSCLIRKHGGEVVFCKKLPDSLECIQEALEKALGTADLIICTGGSSVGYSDLLRDAIKSFPDSAILVHGIQVKPGKPVLIGKIQDKIILGLPGHPTSAVIATRNLLIPSLKKMLGAIHYEEKITGILLRSVYGTRGRRTFKTAILKKEKGRSILIPLPARSSSVLTFGRANVIFSIGELQEKIEENSEIEASYFTRKWADIIIAGSWDKKFETVIKALWKRGIRAYFIKTGNSIAKTMLKTGEADIVSISCLPEDEINCEVKIRRKIVCTKAREKIQTVAARRDSALIKIARKYASKILPVGTDSAALNAVMNGRADVAIIPKYVAEQHNVDYEEIGEEILCCVGKDRKHTKQVITELKRIVT